MSSRNLSEVGNDGKKTLGQKNTHGVPFSRAEFLQKLLNSNTSLDTPQLVDRSNLHAICFSEGPHSGRGKAVWGDQGLSRKIVSGFSLAGEMPESDQFQPN